MSIKVNVAAILLAVTIPSAAHAVTPINSSSNTPAPSQSAANIFSFESPAVNGYVYNPSVAGETFNNGSGITPNNTAFILPAAPDGRQVAFLQNGFGNPGQLAEIRLNLTGLVVGDYYTATYETSKRRDYSANPLEVEFNNTDVGDLAASSISYGWTQSITSIFRATGTTGTLSFIGTGPTSGDITTGLDNVILSAGAVPEPTTWAMMLVGLGMIGFAVRRRQNVGISYA